MNFNTIRASAVGALLLSTLLSTPAAGQDPATLKLTVEDAVQRAIEHNPELAIVRLQPDVQDARVAETRAAYQPVFTTVFGRSSTVTPPTNFLVGSSGTDLNDLFSSTGVRQRLRWGAGTWSVSWDAARTTTNSPISSFDPNLQSGILLAFSQPLLRDRKIDATRHEYIVAQRNHSSSELRFRESVVQTVAAVKQAYWTLKATMANVDVQQRSVDLAAELARLNRLRVAAGQLAPVDLVQAEAEVARRRENLIVAAADAKDAEDRLRRLIMDPADGAFWQAALDPVDAPEDGGSAPDVDAAITRALGTRLDLARADLDLENAKTTVAFLNNQRLPDVRLETSYRGAGLGGTQFVRTGDFPGTITGTRNRSFGDALGQTFLTDYPAWSVGVTVSYPLGHSYEDASHARAQVEERQIAQRIASLRQETIETVRKAGRYVQSTAERVSAARASATLAEQRVSDEQRRYDVGLSTTFLVTQAQRDLLQAQVSLLQTMLEHQSALVSFEAVQQAPPVGSREAIGISGADIVRVPVLEPRGLFRPGAGQ